MSGSAAVTGTDTILNTVATSVVVARNVAQPSCRPSVQWEYIVQLSGRPVAHLLDLQGVQGLTGMTVFNVFSKEYNLIKPNAHWYNTAPQIYEVVISPYCVHDPEALDYPREVIIDSSIPMIARPDFTAAFLNPTLLSGTKSFLAQNTQFNISLNPGQAGRQRRALLIKTETNKFVLVAVIVVVMLGSIGAGISVGLVAHRLVLGLAMTAGLIGVLGFIQVLSSDTKLVGRKK